MRQQKILRSKSSDALAQSFDKGIKEMWAGLVENRESVPNRE